MRTETPIRYLSVGNFYWMVTDNSDHPQLVQILRFNVDRKTVVFGAGVAYMADVQAVDSGQFEKFALVSNLFERQSEAYRHIQQRFQNYADYAELNAKQAEEFEEACNRG
jgi:hypothetical protein